MLQLRCGNPQELNSCSFRRSEREPPPINWLESCRLRTPPTKRAACGCKRPSALNSNQRLVSPAPFVVQANTHDVIGQAAVEGRGQGGRRYGNRLLQLAEVHIEVFDLRAPAAAERALDASAGGPAGPHVIDACRRNGPDAGCVGGVSVLGLPVSHTSRSGQQEIGSGQKAKTRPRGPEPLELVISGQRGGRKCQDWKRRTAFLTGGLNVGFQPEYPCSKLIIVAGLDAANDAVDVLGFLHIDAEADNTSSVVVSRLAPAIADVPTPIDAGPAIDGRGRRRRRVSRPRVHVRGPRGRGRQHNESGRSKEEFFHLESPIRCSVRQAAALTFPRQQLEPLTPAKR